MDQYVATPSIPGDIIIANGKKRISRFDTLYIQHKGITRCFGVGGEGVGRIRVGC
jgi:hypothetical protein